MSETTSESNSGRLTKMRILLADDHPLLRQALKDALEKQSDFEVIAEASNGEEAVRLATEMLPDLVIMDISMPILNGLEATKRISRECPQTKVLILTQYDEEENMLVAKDAGAFGFIPKRAASSELVAGIRSVSGGRYFPAYFAEMAAS